MRSRDNKSKINPSKWVKGGGGNTTANNSFLPVNSTNWMKGDQSAYWSKPKGKKRSKAGRPTKNVFFILIAAILPILMYIYSHNRQSSSEIPKASVAANNSDNKKKNSVETTKNKISNSNNGRDNNKENKINDRNKNFVYVNIPQGFIKKDAPGLKTLSSSVKANYDGMEEYLHQPYSGCPVWNVPKKHFVDGKSPYENHADVPFTFVRNPYYRMLQTYRYMCSNNRKFLQETLDEHSMFKPEQSIEECQQDTNQMNNFLRLTLGPKHNIDHVASECMFLPQSDYIFGDKTMKIFCTMNEYTKFLEGLGKKKGSPVLINPKMNWYRKKNFKEIPNDIKGLIEQKYANDLDLCPWGKKETKSW